MVVADGRMLKPRHGGRRSCLVCYGVRLRVAQSINSSSEWIGGIVDTDGDALKE